MSLIIVFLIGVVFYFVKKENFEKPEKNLDNNLIAIYVENEDGNYILSNNKTFPTNGYKLNYEKSVCNNDGIIESVKLKIKSYLIFS